jgi:hypothetical protein
MPTLDDQAYFRMRAATERERANACSDPAIARTHRQMADAYDRRLIGQTGLEKANAAR